MINIAIDFDGTIVDHAYPEIGKPNPGAIDCIKRLHEMGANIILNTMRSGVHLDDAVEYLEKEGIVLYGINEHPTQKSWTNSPKVYADLYIDDAAYGCPLTTIEGFNRKCVDWSRVSKDIDNCVTQNI